MRNTVTAFQDQVAGIGRMPATMRSAAMAHTLLLERYGGEASVPLPSGGSVAPGETLRATALGIPSLIDPTVRFKLLDAAGTILLDASKKPALFSSQVVFNFNAPLTLGLYTLEAWQRTYPVLPFQHKVATTFQVILGTPPQVPPPSTGGLGGFNFGDLKMLGFIALGIVAIIVLAPMVGKVIPERRSLAGQNASRSGGDSV